MRRLLAGLLLAATPSLARAGDPPALNPAAEPTPPGVTQIIPRGVLAAIVDPVFVSADEAGLPDDQWILGVEIGGEAHAYDLNLLNHHEVVNDVVADQPVAAVW
jgi:hypothetical protein